MTKAELIRALAELPESGEILVEPLPDGRGWRPSVGELCGLVVEIVPGDGPENPAFAALKPDSTRPDGPIGF
jgi:hypothetical protein